MIIGKICQGAHRQTWPGTVPSLVKFIYWPMEWRGRVQPSLPGFRQDRASRILNGEEAASVLDEPHPLPTFTVRAEYGVGRLLVKTNAGWLGKKAAGWLLAAGCAGQPPPPSPGGWGESNGHRQ